MFQRRNPNPVRLFWGLTGWRILMPMGTGALFVLIGLAEPAPTPPRVETRETVHERDVDLRVTDVVTLADGFSDGVVRIVSYEWRAPDGATMRDSEEIPADVLPDLAVGDVIPVTLREVREVQIEVQDPVEPWGMAPVLLGLGGLVWAILAAWLGWAGWHVASAWRAARQGEVREARIAATAVIPGQQSARASWVDALGNTGTTQPRPRDDLPAAGSVIVVYSDPVTGRGWWEEDL